MSTEQWVQCKCSPYNKQYASVKSFILLVILDTQTSECAKTTNLWRRNFTRFPLPNHWMQRLWWWQVVMWLGWFATCENYTYEVQILPCTKSLPHEGRDWTWRRWEQVRINTSIMQRSHIKDQIYQSPRNGSSDDVLNIIPSPLSLAFKTINMYLMRGMKVTV
jgi:hypothetical protein